MTLEDAGEDQIAHRQRRIERLRRAAAGGAQRLVACPADLALPSRGRVQAQRHWARHTVCERRAPGACSEGLRLDGHQADAHDVCKPGLTNGLDPDLETAFFL